MNEKGFGIKEFIIIISVVFISLIIIMALFQSIFQNAESNQTIDETIETVTYEDLEKSLEKAAERYQNDTYSGNTNETEVWSLSYSMLREEKYLDKLIDPNDKKECTGYVEFIQDGAKISYKPYLKCGDNYQTKGYDENNLN